MDRDIKACVFGGLVLGAYVVHQVTVGGDGVVFGSVIAAIVGVGGYVIGRGTDRVG